MPLPESFVLVTVKVAACAFVNTPCAIKVSVIKVRRGNVRHIFLFQKGGSVCRYRDVRLLQLKADMGIDVCQLLAFIGN